MTDTLGRFFARSDYASGAISTPVGDDPARLETAMTRMRQLLASLGDPHRGRPTVHVAGTKGKGSVCALLDSICVAAGVHTGRTTSPHLHHLRERIAIDGRSLAEAPFLRCLGASLDAADRLDDEMPGLAPCTAFEVVTAAAFVAFAEADCQVAIVETGLGGTWDATNVVDADIAVVTRLDYDHQAILGSTLGSIAANKAGIIEPGRPVVTCDQPPEALAVIVDTAARLDAPLWLAGRDFRAAGSWRAARFTTPLGTVGPVRLGLHGQHQRENASLAVMTASLLAARFPAITPLAIAQGLHRAVWPARLETIDRPGAPTVVVDGAHTPASAAALASAIRDLHPRAPVTLVFGALAGKDAAGMLDALAPVAARIIVTATDSPRAQAIAGLRAVADGRGAAVAMAPTVEAALALADTTTPAAGVVVVAGSLAIAADARAALGRADDDPGTNAS